MPIQYIEAPSDEQVIRSPFGLQQESIFLAGGITGCPDWQQAMVQHLRKQDYDLTVYNPRRAEFPMDDPTAARQQIEWEYNKLNNVSMVVFWFCAETLCPIVLFELGAMLRTRSEGELCIGCHPEYERLQDVQIQTSLIEPDLRVHVGWDEFVSGVDALIEYPS